LVKERRIFISTILKTGENQITQKYSKTHEAVDLVKEKNQSDLIIAHSAGTVIFVQTGYKNERGSTGNRSYGNCVKIEHKNGYFTLYAHLSEVYVKKGEYVEKGQTIGKMGDSGNAYGVHLHFEVQKNNKRMNPTPYLNSDLPENAKIDCEYRVWNNVRKEWLPKVKNVEDYAGIFGEAVGGFQLVTYGGGKTKLRAHIKNGTWLDEVIDGAFGSKDSEYAGLKGKSMDAIAIWSEYGSATYRVHIKGGNWLPWIKGRYDIYDYNGYAGMIGKEIDAIECYIK
jgi:hypothetical protein